MKREIVIVALIAVALVAYVGLQRTSVERTGEVRAAIGHEPVSANGRPASAARANASTAQAWDTVQARPAASPTNATPLPPVVPDAALSLADAMRDGDTRTPPIVRDEIVDDPPTLNELADPAAYRRYETRRNARVHRSFEREAGIALLDQRRDLDRAKAQGAPPEILAEGEEKAQKLAETLRRLRDGAFDAAPDPEKPAPKK